MPCKVETYADSPDSREELISFLARQFSEVADLSLWRRRLAHWWDENPCAADVPHRGWVLRHEDRLVGFLGVIPALYAYQGKPVTSLIATSWVVEKEHRNSAVPMAIHLQRLGRTHLLLDTTPSLEVQSIISRGGWVGETRVRRILVLLGLPGRLVARYRGRGWPVLSAGRRITTDIHVVSGVVRPWQREDRIEKWNSLESLRWYAAGPARKHLFIGAVDAEGMLTSYLWLTPRRRMGLACLSLLEAFSTEADDMELEALVGVLVRREVDLPGPKAALMSLLAFPQDPRWAGVPGMAQEEAHVCHFHFSPPALLNKPKHTVMAEGDFGL
ncbi:hypothetical protein EI77_01774 [Prosthecobacter fusiformis]|uniref:Acetyltransferase (GNAT) family protein n=1 Tax=Prosthecobacter fusiformis TaxID=48464 RepID=A0A4R7S4P4_9BACT|nr:hypothetical protein [Prosthecobacter fusiformis]TDU73304.1 hypothetical protein EI77_01774 [Prosthecobacter fusiformis]